MEREIILNLVSNDTSAITIMGLLVLETPLHWVLDEVYEDTLTIKYPRRERLLYMSKSGWKIASSIDLAKA